MARGDAISLVEAAYRLDTDDKAWLTQLVEEAHAVIGVGAGTAAMFVDARDLANPRRYGHAQIGFPRWREFEAAHPETPEINERLFGPPRGSLRASLAGAADESGFVSFLRRFGVSDGVGLIAVGTDRSGVVVCSFSEHELSIPRRTLAQHGRLAAHITAAYRLRRYLATHDAHPRAAEAEAVLSPGGKVEHALPPAQTHRAREALRHAARAVDRARTRRGRQDADAALEAWRGLVAGRWTLIDTHDSDGRRYWVARKNDPEVPDPRGLTARERQVLAYHAMGHSQKLIAYELGLAPSTVWTHLARAKRKLGLLDRADVMRLFARLAAGEAMGAERSVT